MNHMPEVLRMMGIRPGKKFDIIGVANNPHRFDSLYYLYNTEGEFINDEIVVKLIRGVFKIENLVLV